MSGKGLYRNRIFYSYNPASFPLGYTRDTHGQVLETGENEHTPTDFLTSPQARFIQQWSRAERGGAGIPGQLLPHS